MRAALTALADELKRLKSAGVKSVIVSDESIANLRRAVEARAKRHPTSAPRASQVAEVPVTPKAAEKKADVTAPPVAPKAAYTPPTPKMVLKPNVPDTMAPIPAPPTVKLPTGSKQERWDALLSLVTNDPVCKLHVRPEKKVVLGVGSLDAKIFFCGEAPGGEEEDKGEPFVGPAGQLLTKMIQAMGLARRDVYIGNIMNWRPEMPLNSSGVQVGNRPPTEEEMAYCSPYFRAQLDVVKPEVIVALGGTAAEGLLGADSFKTVGEIRGRWKLFAETPVIVTYHPSYILRNPTNRSKRAIWEDLLKVMERLSIPISDKQRGFFLDK